jgi:hypothetical protein
MIDAKPIWPEVKLANETKSTIEAALQQLQHRPEALLPGFSPIVAGGKVIYRSYWGTHVVDINTGELQWDSRSVAGLEALLGHPNRKNDVLPWLAAYKQGSNQNVLFENSVIGTSSTDYIRVYLVDDMGLPPHQSITQGNPVNLGSHVREFAQHSKLGAINLETGKMLWEHGGSEMKEPELAGCYFLGPPLPLADKLYICLRRMPSYAWHVWNRREANSFGFKRWPRFALPFSESRGGGSMPCILRTPMASSSAPPMTERFSALTSCRAISPGSFLMEKRARRT